MITTRFATVAATLCLVALAALPARAQWVPCDPSGTPIRWAYTVGNGCYPMYGTLTVQSSGSQTPAGLATSPKYLYSPYPYASLSYDPYNDDDTGVGADFEADNGWAYNPNTGSSSPAASAGSLTCDYAWAAYFVWQGQSPPPKPYADFLLATAVAAYAERASYVSAAPPGLSASATAGDDVFNEQESAIYQGAPYLNNVTGGNHLVRAQVTQQNGKYLATVTLMGSVSAQAANSSTAFPDGSPLWVAGGGSVTGSVKPDTREVTITSTDIETSYSKGADDVTGVGYQVPHLRNSDGSIQTDSAAAWDNELAEWIVGGSASTGYSFTANAVNFQNPTFTWSLQGDGTPVVQTQSDLNTPINLNNGTTTDTIPVKLTFGPNTTDVSGKQTTVRADVTDSDHATAANTFTVNWHLPYETTDVMPSSSGKYVLATRTNPMDPSESGDVQDSPAGQIPMNALLDGTSEVAAASGNEEAAGILKIIGAVATVTDWKFPYGDEPAQSNGDRNDATSWQVAVNLTNSVPSGPAWPEDAPVDLLNDPNGWMDCQMSLDRVAYYTWQFWHADEYTSHGYDSSGHIFQAYTITSVHDEPVFTETTY